MKLRKIPLRGWESVVSSSWCAGDRPQACSDWWHQWRWWWQWWWWWRWWRWWWQTWEVRIWLLTRQAPESHLPTLSQLCIVKNIKTLSSYLWKEDFMMTMMLVLVKTSIKWVVMWFQTNAPPISRSNVITIKSPLVHQPIRVLKEVLFFLYEFDSNMYLYLYLCKKRE